MTTPIELKTLYNITAWDKLKLNYWGIPKCMNTSVKYTLYSQLNPNDSRSVNGIPRWIHHVDLLRYITKGSALVNGNINFTVIRHPYDRVLSLYRDMTFRRRKVNMMPDVDNRKIDGLDEFIDVYIKNSTDADNIHLRSISYFICEDGKPLFDNIFTFDTISEFLQMDVAHINITDPCEITLSEAHKHIIQERYANDFKVEAFKFQ